MSLLSFRTRLAPRSAIPNATRTRSSGAVPGRYRATASLTSAARA